MKRVVVVGGGIAGLAAAYRLKVQASKNNFPIDIQLLEASPRLGGILESVRRDHFLLESGPDCFLSSKPRGLGLCREMGLGDALINTRIENRRSFIVRGGKLHEVPQGFYLMAPSQLKPFLSSKLLSWRGKWRVLLEPLISAKPQKDESLASFVRRRLGREALEWLAQPLLAGIYAADPEILSLRATFPDFLEMEKKFGSVLLGLARRVDAAREASGARYSLFVSLRDGMGSLIRKLVENLSGVHIQTNAGVEKIQRTSDGWDISRSTGETLKADAVCLALPAHQCAALLGLQDKPLAEELRAIPYSHSITLNFAFGEDVIRHPLNGMGFVTPTAESDVPIACTFVHQKFAGRAPAGSTLLRAFLGGDLPPSVLRQSDSELTEFVLQRLSSLLGITGKPHFAVVKRWALAMPQYTVGHVPRVLKIEESALGLPGLTLAGNWQWGVGIPDCIESGERAADATLLYLERSQDLAHR